MNDGNERKMAISDALPFNLNLNLILNKSDYIPTDVLRMIQ